MISNHVSPRQRPTSPVYRPTPAHAPWTGYTNRSISEISIQDVGVTWVWTIVAFHSSLNHKYSVALENSNWFSYFALFDSVTGHAGHIKIITFLKISLLLNK